MTKTPFISIIIPCYNEAPYLKKLFHGLSKQNYPKELYEIIVADNSSTDNTQKVAFEFADRVVVVPSHNTVATVRNSGAKVAKGDLLAFLDADCVPAANWLEMAAQTFSNGEKAFGNKIGIPESVGWIERAWFTRKVTKKAKVKYINSANFFVERKLYKDVNGFNVNLQSGEDSDICARIREFGISIQSNPEINVVHLKNPNTIRSFVKREMWHGVGSLQLLRSNFFDKPFIASLLFLFATVLQIVGILTGAAAIFFYGSLLIIILLLLSATQNVLRSKNYGCFFQIAFLYYFYFLGRSGSIGKLLFEKFSLKQFLRNLVSWLYKKGAMCIAGIYRLSGLNNKPKLRIVCYHSVSDLKEGMHYPRSNVLLKDFKAQMQFLHNEGFHSISFELLSSYLKGKGSLPAKSVVITFDDGFRNVKENALPVLSSFGLNAILFITTDWIDKEETFDFVEWDVWKCNSRSGSDPVVDNGFLPLSSKEIKQLADMENVLIASHGCHHIQHTRLSPSDQKKELANSRQVLKDITGSDVQHFAYPNGAFCLDCFNLAASEYDFIYGVNKGNAAKGAAHLKRPICRHSINMSHSLKDFIVQMNGGYDLFRLFINLFNTIRRECIRTFSTFEN